MQCWNNLWHMFSHGVIFRMTLPSTSNGWALRALILKAMSKHIWVSVRWSFTFWVTIILPMPGNLRIKCCNYPTSQFHSNSNGPSPNSAGQIPRFFATASSTAAWSLDTYRSVFWQWWFTWFLLKNASVEPRYWSVNGRSTVGFLRPCSLIFVKIPITSNWIAMCWKNNTFMTIRQQDSTNPMSFSTSKWATLDMNPYEPLQMPYPII